MPLLLHPAGIPDLLEHVLHAMVLSLYYKLNQIIASFWAAYCPSSIALIPGSDFPSKYSNMAPPPVLM